VANTLQRRNSYYFLIFVIVLGIVSGYLFYTKPASFGLDIKGGTRLTYQIKLKDDQKKSVSIETARSQIIQVLLRRAAGMGAAEPVVAAKGEDQVIVEIPGISDAKKAEEVIGSSARIELYHARNVDTDQAPSRFFLPIRKEDALNPQISFIRKSDQKQIDPGTPEYKQMIEGWTLILAGPELARASAQPKGSSYEPLLEFSSEGTAKMSGWMNNNFGKEENIAAVLDGKVLYISPVQKDARLENNCVIQGTFTPEYVTTIVGLLNAGALPADLQLLGTTTRAASVGEAAYQKIMIAGTASFVLISLYLVAYYSFPGLVALVALLLYTLFTLTAMKLFNATFSLAAIAGFILSVGMAVDANILVFERFKEEMRSGRSLRVAIEIGFKRALPAIFDSNACTILTSVVLASIGTGPVKGFAISLIIGVGISLFTAFTVTRSLLIFLVGSGIGEDKRWYAIDRDWFGKFLEGGRILEVLQKSKKWFIISGLTVLIGAIFWPLGGFKLNVELQGGTEAQFLLNSPRSSKEMSEGLEAAGLKGSSVQFAEATNGKQTVFISVPEDAFKGEKDTAKRTETIAKAAGISDATPGGTTSIGPTLQKEVQLGAAKGVLLSVGLIVIFLAFRFGFSVGGFKEGLKFGLSAIGALLHDILVVIFMAALFGYFFKWDISSLFLTAMLTIIGFSVHDTIVIFDRIRENLRHPSAGEDLEHLMNNSITQSFSRSLNTSGTVIVTLLILTFFGTATPDLKFFVVTMLIGIVSGTYSSIYNASPILYLWDKAIVKKKGEKAGLIGLAKAEIARSAHLRTGMQTAPRSESNTSEAGRSYGQVRRRAKDTVKDSWQELE
jgi:SecD/SecF fusion protein